MIPDVSFMEMALGLARRGLGRVMPNPAVGCILVRDNIVVGRGSTQPGGRPHAETVALAQAGAAATDATAFVTLEPCAHHGRTPPCAEALVQAGIRRCVIAIEDPDPRVSGRGIATLRKAGIVVDIGPLAARATELNAGFLHRLTLGRPLVTLKFATSLDAKIATHRGESRWITGETSRRFAHLLRRQHDAVLVGSGTVLADDPELSVSLAGLAAPAPLRIVMDARLRTPLSAKLIAGAAVATPTLIVTATNADPARRQALRRPGVEFIEVECGKDGALDPVTMLKALGSLGLTRILVEGGAAIATSLLRHRLVDRVAWFRSDGIIGGDGLAAIAAFGGGRLSDQIRGQRVEHVRLGNDVLETFALTP